MSVDFVTVALSERRGAAGTGGFETRPYNLGGFVDMGQSLLKMDPPGHS